MDVLYLQLSDQTPDGVIEISEGVNVDITKDKRIAGIEILDAPHKIDLETVLSCSLEFDKNILSREIA
ncbi:MAG: DUF2283 domain-containing protein [Calditrichaeota bacterium]|nr:MAG: DUF2283 domain-containing protein [Calditrichota bacterium]